nr:copper resistance protein CopC [Micromonospora sp. DSM 115978]
MLTVTGALLSVLVMASPAMAHNSFTGSSPKDGARLAEAPERIQLNFLSRLAPEQTTVTVTGPDGVSAAGGEPAFDGAKVMVPFTLGAAGEYVVGYRTLSSDGHTIKGEVRFTMTTGSAPTAPPTTTAAPPPSAPPSQPPAATPADAAPLDPSGDTGGGAWWPWLLVAALALGALGGGLFLVRRRRAG